MEKEQFYNTDNYVGKDLIFNKGFVEDDTNLMVKKTTAVPSMTKPAVIPERVIKPTVLNTDILKPSIDNTGVYVPIIKPGVLTMDKPVTANSPVILVPNVPGGMVVNRPSPIVDLQKMITASKAGQIGMKAKLPSVDTVALLNPKAAIVNAADTGNKLAGMGLPSPLVIGGMILAVIAFYFIARKK